ncbi:hypothetical protein GRJ2_001838300 [Grus japonensis]|uniref:Uncharacterized protein n=1 Tax=Grus japonensis TaxID=30415 RepID=A0ABC9X7V5_GRUJA
MSTKPIINVLYILLVKENGLKSLAPLLSSLALLLPTAPCQTLAVQSGVMSGYKLLMVSANVPDLRLRGADGDLPPGIKDLVLLQIDRAFEEICPTLEVMVLFPDVFKEDSYVGTTGHLHSKAIKVREDYRDLIVVLYDFEYPIV